MQDHLDPNYWSLSSNDQQYIRQQAVLAELEAFASEHDLIIHHGKAIKPEDYPCQCEKQSPYHCFEETKDSPDNEWSKAEPKVFLKAAIDKMCPCPCHTYWED